MLRHSISIRLFVHGFTSSYKKIVIMTSHAQFSCVCFFFLCPYPFSYIYARHNESPLTGYFWQSESGHNNTLHKGTWQQRETCKRYSIICLTNTPHTTNTKLYKVHNYTKCTMVSIVRKDKLHYIWSEKNYSDNNIQSDVLVPSAATDTST